MVQLTGGDFTKVNGLKTAVDFKVFEPGKLAEPISPVCEVLVRYGVSPSKILATEALKQCLRWQGKWSCKPQWVLDGADHR